MGDKNKTASEQRVSVNANPLEYGAFVARLDPYPKAGVSDLYGRGSLLWLHALSREMAPPTNARMHTIGVTQLTERNNWMPIEQINLCNPREGGRERKKDSEREREREMERGERAAI